MAYFRSFPAGEDPHRLLRPEEHVSTPWGASDHGPCDKCEQRGTVIFRCRSCMETGPRSDCPACHGRVEFEAVCPTCGGSSEITETVRSGVSVFPTIEGLYRYLVERDKNLEDMVIVELNGRLSDGVDLDGDCGALLIHPTQVVTRHPIDDERIADLRRRLGADREESR
jgi:hypothetical protein